MGTIEFASVARPGDVGIDLPAGACASALRSADYHLIDMESADATATIWHSGDVGIDLPAGTSAAVLRPTDYRPIEMEPEDVWPIR